MQRDQAQRQLELLERIAKSLEKKKVKKEASKISKEVLDTIKTITDDYVVYNGKLKPVKDIPGFEGTLDALDNLTSDFSKDDGGHVGDKCECASCEENPTTTWSNKDLHESKLHTDEGSEEDDTVHNDYLLEIVEDMNQIAYLQFCHEMGYVSNDANKVTSNINELEYEECLGAIKKALFIKGDDEYVETVECSGFDKDRKDKLAKDYIEGVLDSYAEVKANNKEIDKYTYDNELREYHCGVVNDSDFNIRKAAYSYDAAIDEGLHTKKDCIMDYVTNEFGSNGARYTDIIKFAYYLGSPNAPKYSNANRGYYSCAFAMRYGGHLITGGKDQLVKGINKENDERYFALSFVESATDYWKYLDEVKRRKS